MTNIRNIKLNAFSKVFNDFLNNLDKLQPNDTSLLLIRTTINILSTETLVNQFMSYTDKYTHKILNKDESFFINELPGDNSFISNEINRLSKLWIHNEITEDDKECIWNYFISLVKLGKSIMK